MSDLTGSLARAWPPLAAFALTLIALWVANTALSARVRRRGGEHQLTQQLTMLLLSAVGLIAIILTLPVGEGTRGQLIGLLGLVFSAVIALSSTTFVSNAMAGLMLRAVRSFRPGDFVRVGDEFGRVTERGLFHTEIQTEDRDLTTLPNLYLVTNPLTVVHASGTIVSTHLSLGYDVERHRIEERLLKAAEAADLTEPFVQVMELGDYSVTYRVAGFLPEVKQLLSARSRLRKFVLDVLHDAGIEIASPTLMVQRPLPEGHAILPERRGVRPAAVDEGEPESIIFDKADRVAEREELRAEREQLSQEIEDLRLQLPSTAEPARDELERRIADVERRLTEIDDAMSDGDDGS